MSRDQNEIRLYDAISTSLRRWLLKAHDKVMAPWRSHRMQPDPHGVYQVQDQWNHEVDMLLTVIGQISMNAWNEATGLPPVSRHAFVMSQLAQTRNLLVRLPDEVYNLIFAEIVDATNNGESLESVAERIDGVLSYTDSERWPHRARTIAITETTRAYGYGTMAAGLDQGRRGGRRLLKRWVTEHDPRVRATHRAADGQTVDVSSVFQVGDFPLLYPGDPMGPPEEVINCRCDLIITERGRDG